jgi:hypothetical protein
MGRMPKSTGCSQSRKISEDNVGQEILKKQIKRILHGERAIIVKPQKDLKNAR